MAAAKGTDMTEYGGSSMGAPVWNGMRRYQRPKKVREGEAVTGNRVRARWPWRTENDLEDEGAAREPGRDGVM